MTAKVKGVQIKAINVIQKRVSAVTYNQQEVRDFILNDYISFVVYTPSSVFQSSKKFTVKILLKNRFKSYTAVMSLCDILLQPPQVSKPNDPS